MSASDELEPIQKLRLIDTLTASPGFAFFLEQVAKERDLVLALVEDATEQNLLAKASGSLKAYNIVLNLQKSLAAELREELG